MCPCPVEDEAVPGVGELVGADRGGVGDGIGRFHHQRHGDHGVAAVKGGEGGILCSRPGEGDAVPGVGELVVADGGGVGDGVCGFHEQRHGNHGVAAMDGLEGGALCSRPSEGDAVPGVGEPVSADGGGIGNGVGWVDK